MFKGKTWQRGYNNLSLKRKVAVKHGAPLVVKVHIPIEPVSGKHRHTVSDGKGFYDGCRSLGDLV